MKNMIFAIILCGLLFTSPAEASLFKHERAVVSMTKVMMGTIVEIKVPVERDEERKALESAIDAAFLEIGRVEGVFSVYKSDSEISRVNKLKRGEKMVLSDEAFSLLEKSIDMSDKTDGAFDITVRPLVELWGFGKGDMKVPSQADIETAIKKVGYKKIYLDPGDRSVSFLGDGMSLDLGANAKGYATDRAIGILKKAGIKNAIVNSGGDMYCLGKRSRKDPWKIGIRHPRKTDDLFLEMRLEDMAAVTSGDYEKYFEAGGRRYSHIIDPRAGYPEDSKVMSATVIAKDSTTADALATAMCVMGEKGLKIIESIDGADAILIIEDRGKMRTEMTKGFKTGYYVIERKALKE
jgi:thiamine biosynthesis lipoprotein